MSRPKGEFHSNNQQMSKLLHKAIGLGGKGNPNGQVRVVVMRCCAQLPCLAAESMLAA